MSASDRATSAELAAEFERAMGSLAERPIGYRSSFSYVASAMSESEVILEEIRRGATRESLADMMTRIAAIALEGAARLRRGT